MTNQVDAARRQGEKNRRSARRIRWITLLAVALIVIAAQGCAAVLLQPAAYLYKLDGTDWREVELPEGEIPRSVLTTGDGSVWVQTDTECGLLRYRDGAWSDCANLPPSAYSYYGQIYATTYDDEVWVTYDSDVHHFDGADWTSYDGVAPYNATGIAATRSQVFITDWASSLTTYDGARWQTQPLTTILPNITGSYYYGAQVMRGEEDEVFLSQGSAIYRFTDGQWSQLTGSAATSYTFDLLGYQDDLLWVADGGLIRVVNTRAQTPAFQTRTTGLPTNYGLYDLEFRGDVPYLLAGTSLYRWEDRRWILEPTTLPFLGASSRNFAVDTDQTLWLVVQISYSFDPYREVRRDAGLFMRYGWWLIGIAGLIGASLLNVGAARRGRMAQGVVWDALFDVPDTVTVQAGGGWYHGWRPLLALSIAIAMFGVPYGYIRDSAAGQIAAVLPIFGVLLLPIFMRWRGYRPKRRSRAIEDGILNEAHVLLLAVGIGALLFVPLTAIWMRYDFEPVIGVILLPASALYVAWVILRWVYARAVQRLTALVDAAQTDAAREAAEQRIIAAERWLPIQRQMIALRAALAMQRGEHHAAELLYRQMIYEYQTQPETLAAGLIGLADALIAQGDVDSAGRVLETAISVLPESPRGYERLEAITKAVEMQPTG